MSKTFYLLVLMAMVSSCKKEHQALKELSIKGLESFVEINRDTWGINHIYAGNQHDLFFAQGYAAAKDRLFQFEIRRKQTTSISRFIFPRPRIDSVAVESTFLKPKR